jgi:hypothetical protein
MARVYSTRLISELGVSGSGVIVATVPLGHVYVLRDMTARSVEVPAIPLGGFLLSIDGGPHIWDVGPFGVMARHTYEASSRQVALSGDSIIMSTGDAGGWDLLVSGYDLELP